MAIQFVTASSEYFEYADNPAIKSGTGSFSIFIRVYHDSAASTMGMLCKGNSSGSPGNGDRYEFNLTTSAYNFTIDDNSNKTDATWSTTHTQDTWLNFVLVRDSGNTLKMYEAGTERASGTDITTGNIDTTMTLVVGARVDSGSTIQQFFDGRLCDIAYINRIASAGEIASYNAGYSAQFFRPDAYWGFIRETYETVASIALSATGGTPNVDTHPQIIFPTSQILHFPTDAVSGGLVSGGLAGEGGLAGVGGLAGYSGGLAG